jgi:MraZ protein
MASFIGEFACKLDAKLRIALPSGLKKQMPVSAEGRFVINRGFEKHLVLYPFHEWEAITEELNELNLYVKKHREFVRYLHRGATELTLDGSGRLLLPKRLLTYAGIKDEVVLLAYSKRIEVWDSELYESMLEDEPEDFSKLAEEIMGDKDSSETEDTNREIREFPSPSPQQRH